MRVAFYTLGCKVNQYETQIMTQHFIDAGYDIVDCDGQADVFVINSCTVTASGDSKTRKLLRRFKSRCPGAVIALTGCFPQAFPQAAESLPEADVITGARERALLPELVKRALDGERVVMITPHERGEPFEPMSVQAGALGRTRALIKIEDGCPRRCSYCIIPTARGPVRSKTPEQIAAEAAGLAEAGYRELVLVGINLSCYGMDLGLSPSDAVSAASSANVARVRLGSLEPELITPERIKALREQPKLCPHFHLSLQSGCEQTLKRMKRPYTPGEYMEIVSALRGAFDDCAITTDIMTGFPGEDDGEFARSLDFAKQAGFAKAHVFPYSRRPGTQADAMPDQIETHVKEQRARVMIEAMERSRDEFLRGLIGRGVRVLIETEDDQGAFGHTENYSPVHISGAAGVKGKICEAVVTGVSGGRCIADGAVKVLAT